jgi:Flp pilus assembly protein TadD
VAAALADPRRAVRFAALRSDAGTAETRRRVLDEFVAATACSDSPSEWTDLGVLYAIAGRATDAEAALRRALRIDPTFPDAQANLRALLNTPGH